MAYQSYVIELKDVRKHPNADRMKLATVFGNTVCVGLDYVDGMKCVYFPTDGQLSEEFCKVNDLVRRKNPETGEYEGGYMDPVKRNVKTIKLRGEPSDGLVLPISCLDYCFTKGAAADNLNIGDTITVLNGHEICQKYIPRTNVRKGKPTEGNRTRKKKVPVAPLFNEHADTEQLAYNLGAFNPGDQIEITLKMHGTSQRTGYLPVLKGFKRSIIDRIMKRQGTPIYDWGYVSGTRRTVLDSYDAGFYGSNQFRKQHADLFEGKLHKGEEVFYEVVGFTDTGTPIMGQASNAKVDKDFVKQYGEITTFSYGCTPDGRGVKEVPVQGVHTMTIDGVEQKVPDGFTIRFQQPIAVPQSDIYVYRMTMTNEDGDVVEYTPDFMRYRCEQMGVKCVPVFWSGFIPENPASKDDDTITAGEWIMNKAEMYYDGSDPVGKTHVREGVVVRILNRPKFCAYKYKNVPFKILEGIYKETAIAPDMEEMEEIQEENEE